MEIVIERSAEVYREVSDGRWHKVSWDFQEGRLNIMLDELPLPINEEVSLATLNDQDPMVTVYMGARPFVPGLLRQLFTLK